jgi:uncharacterized protein YndB with AHSA1/START domain
MEAKPLIVERTYNAAIEKVWKALTDKDQMKEWYFDIAEFKPEKGFKFTFEGGDENKKYLHECEVLVAEPPNRLSYSWKYPKYAGYSVVTFELFQEGEKKTRVKLSHEGLDSFPKDDSNFGIGSFTEGWNSILGESLKKYVETETIKKSISISASPQIIWEILLNPNNQWGKAFGGGAFVKTDWTPGSEVLWTDTNGTLGARGIVKDNQRMKYLQVGMFDDVNAAPGSPTGEYSEKYSLSKGEGGVIVLSIESGQLAKKYIDEHSAMWQRALEMIKELAESK